MNGFNIRAVNRTLRRRSSRRRLARGAPIELLLDLNSVRTKLGKKWPKVAPSVCRFAVHVIERHLTGRSTYVLQGDVFVIRFEDMSRAEAARMRFAIENDLMELLFGTGTPASTKISARTKRELRTQKRWIGYLLRRLRRVFRAANSHLSESDPSEHLSSSPTISSESSGGRLPLATLPSAPAPTPVGAASPESVVTQRPAGATGPPAAGVRETAPSPAAGNPAVQQKAVATTDDWWRVNARPQARPTSKATKGNTAARRMAAAQENLFKEDDELVFIDPVEDAPVFTSSRGRGRVRRASTDALERALYAAILDAQHRNDIAQRTRLFPPMGTRFLYRPLWMVERGILPIYTCTPACALGPFEFVTGEALIPKGTAPRKIAMLDELLVEHVAKELRPREAAQLQSIVCIPVHYQTLVGDRAAAWVTVLDRISPEALKHLVIEVIGVSQGVGQLTTYSLVRKLKARVRSVFGRLDLTDANFRVWRETDLSVVGIDVEADDRAEIDIICDINHFIAPAKQHGLRTYVRGLRSYSMAVAAIASGVDYIDGPAVADGDFVLPVMPNPFGVFDVYRED